MVCSRDLSQQHCFSFSFDVLHDDVVIFAPQKKGRHVSILAPVLLLAGGFIEGVPMCRHCRSLNKISHWSRISQAVLAYLYNTYNLCSSCRLLQEAETYKEVVRQIWQFIERNTDVEHDSYFSCRLCRGVFDPWNAESLVFLLWALSCNGHHAMSAATCHRVRMRVRLAFVRLTIHSPARRGRNPLAISSLRKSSFSCRRYRSLTENQTRL